MFEVLEMKRKAAKAMEEAELKMIEAADKCKS
jgi:hypothetical protein